MAKKPKKEEEQEALDAAEQEDGGEGNPAPKRKLSLKLIIIGVAGLVIVGGGAATAYALLGGSHEAKSAAPTVKPVTFVDMPDVLVNLSGGTTDRTQYLKVKLALELPDQSIAAQIQPMMPRVVDTFQTYLRELRPADLEGSAGLYRLKEELTRRVNAALAPHRVNAVLFKEIVIQ